MGNNTLVEGYPRIGWMVDGDPTTPEIAVMLERTDEAIQLTIPTKGMFERDDPYGRWFSSSVKYGDDPDRTRFRYTPPSSLLFNDHRGHVSLVGCRQAAASFGSNGGFGRVVADYAVLGGRSWANFERVNGVRTEIPGLAEWTGISSRRTEVTSDKANRTVEYTITMRSPAAQRLARSKNLTLRPSWRSSAPAPGTIATHDVIQIETTAKKPQAWDGLLAPHRAVQDLLSLSAWRQFGFSQIEIGVAEQPSRHETPATTGDNKIMVWSEVVTHRLRLADTAPEGIRFLFDLADIGAPGVQRWLRLRSKHERALLPLIGIIDERGLFVETRVSQTGIAIEALGFQLASEGANGSKLNSRGQITYNDAMEAILADMPVVPVPDVAAWKDRSRQSYMGVKHADNQTPDIVTLANAYRENALVLRYWVAGRLGCSADTLRRRLDRDPLSGSFVAT